MSVIAMGSRCLYDASFNAGYLVMFSHMVLYFGDKVVGHVGGVCPIHTVAYGVLTFMKISQVGFVRRVKYRSLWH
jgi:hypothetical protein